ncbi:hypothetical protein O181_060158 [Austropuccinia psidii MF-1]|uniref:Reverse transcriptase domain-containing protein n=1 Tax=Austropuccinia psidii MF-1 TaxID=1389203 RepID=A0A9Q3EG13_9BASI|nr:hypothetical protein [Austropuccinia psidii MF-1]
MIPVVRGLPQGSPLSVTLYLIYNSALLIQNQISFDSDRISIGYIDDVTHLISATSPGKAMDKLKEICRQTLDWGKKAGSEFDKKKTKLIIFSQENIEPQSIQFGGETLLSTTEAKWLGIHLDSQLFYKQHVNNLNNKASTTLAQINQISNRYFRSNSTDTRLLIKKVLYPRLLYGGILWLNEKNKGISKQNTHLN